MAGSMFLRAYLRLVQPRDANLATPLPRPDGMVIWAVCADPRQVAAMDRLSDQLKDDGEDVTVLTTTPDADQPRTRHATRMFIDHWRPDLVLWAGGPLDPAVMFEIEHAAIPRLLVGASADTIALTYGRLFPGLLRRFLRGFGDVLTTYEDVTKQAIKAGASPDHTRFIGRLEAGIPVPSCNETERATLATTFSARPIWLAADLPYAELSILHRAYRDAARRAHRTLLILAPRNTSDGKKIAADLRAGGLSVARRGAEEMPKDATQIYVVDTDEGLGLWCRLAPITYLGGSLSSGEICDPFAPALLGSAVLAGPKIANHTDHFGRLSAAKAVTQIDDPADFGRAIEMLLATDHAARQAHAAWDVTSQGADATNDLVTTIYVYLDQVNT